jgi:hypothetical protein
MIISFEMSQDIECPIEKVFLFLCDFTNMPLWNYYIQNVTKITEGSVAEGTIFEQKRPHDLYRYKMQSMVYPNKVVAELQPPGPYLHLGFELKDKGKQTEVTYTWRLDLENYKLLRYVPRGRFKNWLLSFAEKPIQKKTKAAVHQNFEKMKILLETSRVTLQDGRSVTLKDK